MSRPASTLSEERQNVGEEVGSERVGGQIVTDGAGEVEIIAQASQSGAARLAEQVVDKGSVVGATEGLPTASGKRPADLPGVEEEVAKDY